MATQSENPYRSRHNRLRSRLITVGTTAAALALSMTACSDDEPPREPIHPNATYSAPENGTGSSILETEAEERARENAATLIDFAAGTIQNSPDGGKVEVFDGGFLVASNDRAAFGEDGRLGGLDDDVSVPGINISYKQPANVVFINVAKFNRANTADVSSENVMEVIVKPYGDSLSSADLQTVTIDELVAAIDSPDKYEVLKVNDYKSPELDVVMHTEITRQQIERTNEFLSDFVPKVAKRAVEVLSDPVYGSHGVDKLGSTQWLQNKLEEIGPDGYFHTADDTKDPFAMITFNSENNSLAFEVLQSRNKQLPGIGYEIVFDETTAQVVLHQDNPLIEKIAKHGLSLNDIEAAVASPDTYTVKYVTGNDDWGFSRKAEQPIGEEFKIIAESDGQFTVAWDDAGVGVNGEKDSKNFKRSQRWRKLTEDGILPGDTEYDIQLFAVQQTAKGALRGSTTGHNT